MTIGISLVLLPLPVRGRRRRGAQLRRYVEGSLGVMSRRTEGDLERFKKFIEARGVETGAYRETLPSRDER